MKNPKSLDHQIAETTTQAKENADKLKINKQLPFLVSDVLEVLPPSGSASLCDAADGAAGENSLVLRTSTRQTVFLPVAGTVDPATLAPGDRVGANKDSYLALETLPAEYDSRVRAFEIEERPRDSYTDVGGLDRQIEEVFCFGEIRLFLKQCHPSN